VDRARKISYDGTRPVDPELIVGIVGRLTKEEIEILLKEYKFEGEILLRMMEEIDREGGSISQ
jgi:hypothetical protein